MLAERPPASACSFATGQRRAAQNARKHGLLSRLRPADDISGLVTLIAQDVPIPFDPTSEVGHAVLALASEEFALARIRERQRAADALLAQDLSAGAFRKPSAAASLAELLDLQGDVASEDAVTALAEEMSIAGVLPPSALERLVADRRVLARYAQEVGARRRRAMTALFVAIEAASAQEQEHIP